jgi:thiamine biosynthesis lipoprotein
VAVTELRFPAMGSDAHVVLVGAGAAAATGARRRIEQLEARWSRFRPGSEVSRLNGASGRPVAVSEDTCLLVQAALTGWRATGGAFDPTVAAAMDANGYGGRDALGLPPAGPAAGLGDVELDVEARTVRFPPGVAFDPGGIGKGLAADLVVAQLAARGAAGVLVSMGGDVRVWGAPPRGDAWVVSVEDPFEPDGDAGVLALRDGAAATSSCLGRRWTRDGREMHHLVDPATGLPASAGVVAVTVVAGAAWWAEIVTKALVLGRGDEHALVGDGAALVWRDDGTRADVGAVGVFFRAGMASSAGTEKGAA